MRCCTIGSCPKRLSIFEKFSVIFSSFAQYDRQLYPLWNSWYSNIFFPKNNSFFPIHPIHPIRNFPQMICNLPGDLHNSIISYIGICDRFKLRLTCKAMEKAVANSDFYVKLDNSCISFDVVSLYILPLT